MNVLSDVIPFTEELNSLSNERFDALISLFNEQSMDCSLLTSKQDYLKAVLGFSRYCFETWQRYPELLQRQIERKHFDQPLSKLDIEQSLEAVALDADKELIKQQLRIARHYCMTWLITRFVHRQDDIAQQMQSLSAMADYFAEVALRYAEYQQLNQYGVQPMNDSNLPMRMTIMGMGKLGGNELNLSSDIDLIFVYPSDGYITSTANKEISHQKYFTKVGQCVIELLNEQTKDGFVFRVDMRLRPWGQSGSLVINQDAFVTYYENHGREWERYALMKARPIAGAMHNGFNVLDELRPFVYRRYMDYSVIESLRDMKRMIAREVLRKGMKDNIKLGEGGIREVEFFVQALQMVRGGINPELQDTRLYFALEKLHHADLIDAMAYSELWSCYQFLRYTEHAIQALEDKQTQLLPSDNLSQKQVAWFMGFEDWPTFLSALDQHRHQVGHHFKDLFLEPESQKQQRSSEGFWLELWQADSLEQKQELLSNSEHCQFCETCIELVHDFQHCREVLTMLAASRDKLDDIMPVILEQANLKALDSEALKRVLQPLKSMTRRSIYLSLMQENIHVLDRMIQLCSLSPWISQLISNHPALLDELINAKTLFDPPTRSVLADDLRQQMLRIPEEDLEQQLLTLRYFKLSNALRIAASEVTGALKLMHVSDALTWLAEVITEQALVLAKAFVIEKYGRPCDKEGNQLPIQFIVIAYGKLGGIELGYNSDLDLVFLYDAPKGGMTNGRRQLELEPYYIRLGQRLVHLFNSQTALGTLYEVDTRLRPSGASGLLVSSLAAYEKYQGEYAWTWEHQALVRSRAIAGNAQSITLFNDIRTSVLIEKRDALPLKEEVGAMREKMRNHLGQNNPELFDLKQDRGGIVDIEFIVQYLVLLHSFDYPQIAKWTDNVRQLEELQLVGILTAETAEKLKQAYIAYRSHLHELALADKGRLAEQQVFASEKAFVMSVWESVFAYLKAHHD